MTQIGFYDLPDYLKRLSDSGDPLVELIRTIDFGSFSSILEIALDYTAGSKEGRPPYDPVTMFKLLLPASFEWSDLNVSSWVAFAARGVDPIRT